MSIVLVREMRGKVLQSSADAYATLPITLSLPPDHGFNIKRIEFVLDAGTVALWTEPADGSIFCTVRTGAGDGSVHNLENKSTLTTWRFALPAGASGVNSYVPLWFTYDAPTGLVTTNPKISVEVDSTGTGQSNRLDYRITYKIVPLTIDQLAALRG